MRAQVRGLQHPPEEEEEGQATCEPNGISFKIEVLSILGPLSKLRQEEKALRSSGAELVEPYSVDWSRASPEKWSFDAITGPGSYFFKFPPEIMEVEGPLREGEKRLKEAPSDFEGMMYQSNMKDWPLDQQRYKLVKRTGSGYSFTPGAGGDFTFVQAKYMALERHDKISMAPDEHTERMSFRGQRLGKPCHPGRGQGVCDVPHIKIIGEIHPNDARLHSAHSNLLLLDRFQSR